MIIMQSKTIYFKNPNKSANYLTKNINFIK